MPNPFTLCTPRRIRLALAVAALTVALSAPASAANYLFYTSGTHDVAGNDANLSVYAGADSLFHTADSNGNPYVATVNIVGVYVNTVTAHNTSAVNLKSGNTNSVDAYENSVTNALPGCSVYSGIYSHGSSTTNISGGSVNRAGADKSSTLNITGGTVGLFDYAHDNATINISGGNTASSTLYESSTLNLSGGDTGNVVAQNAGVVNISGGNLASGAFLYASTAKANFLGTGLSSAYTGYGRNNAYSQYADSFLISGMFGGAAKSYTLYILNGTGTGNSTPRQFAFAPPVAAPEAGTFALTLPLLGIVGAIVAVRRRKVRGIPA